MEPCGLSLRSFHLAHSRSLLLWIHFGIDHIFLQLPITDMNKSHGANLESSNWHEQDAYEGGQPRTALKTNRTVEAIGTIMIFRSDLSVVEKGGNTPPLRAHLEELEALKLRGVKCMASSVRTGAN